MTLTKVGAKFLNNNTRPDVPIMDIDIQRRINSYKEQDKKADREEPNLTIPQVREFLSKPICSHCGVATSWFDWSLDRLDNTKNHSADNLQLTCGHCNVAKKAKENELYILGL